MPRRKRENWSTGYKKRKPAEKLPEYCPACGKDNPVGLRKCPRCGTLKCDFCDMGDDVECPACPLEEIVD